MKGKYDLVSIGLIVTFTSVVYFVIIIRTPFFFIDEHNSNPKPIFVDIAEILFVGGLFLMFMGWVLDRQAKSENRKEKIT